MAVKYTEEQLNNVDEYSGSKWARIFIPYFSQISLFENLPERYSLQAVILSFAEYLDMENPP